MYEYKAVSKHFAVRQLHGVCTLSISKSVIAFIIVVVIFPTVVQ